MIGLIATKEGMTRLFQEDGKSLPVSVLKVATNFVSQIKTKETDGYNSVQLSTQDQKEKNQTKSKIGHYNKNKISLKKYKKLPQYNLLSSKGPMHNPTYKISVSILNSKKLVGMGNSKQQAEQDGAKKLLKNLKIK